KAREVRLKEALTWSGAWVATALLFNVFVYFIYEHQWFGVETTGHEPDGRAAAVMFFTGYVVEKSLSVDNVFVIAMIFQYLGVPPLHQHRVLFWGIVGALLMRAVMILGGVALIDRFHWVLYIFGAFLILTAAKMLLVRHEPDPRRNPLVRLARRLFPVTDEFMGQRFIVRVHGRLALTPLALALIVVESTDLLFAIDSIPAILAITTDHFIVFSSNVFAMLGLRALYFALAGIVNKFHYLKLSLSALLVLLGVKMLLKDVLHAVPGRTYYTLGAIAVVLTAGIVASLVRARRLSPEEKP
ncbi:MAG: TerC/Alx family metal homeostasis membrane protein, partial [Planctomycetes bacterium]|nr:TerC/Alx family metal homeostasis membrane protein [Planctomycetota bacterium]